MPVDLIYDNSVEQDSQEHGKCIHAPEPVFSLVAGLLLKLANEKPDSNLIRELHGNLDVDHTVQASLVSFALQCFGNDLCTAIGDDELPLRQKAGDPCMLQQLQDGVWVDVFDFGTCFDLHLPETIYLPSQSENIEEKTIDKLFDVWDHYQYNYTGSASSVDSRLASGGGHSDAERKAAMCAAIRRQVDSMIAESKALAQSEIDMFTRADTIVAVGAAIFGLAAAMVAFPVAFPAIASFVASYGSVGSLALAGAVGGLTSAAFTAHIQYVRDAEIAAFDDVAAKREIICAWYDALEPLIADISYEDYETAIDVSGSTNPHTAQLLPIFNELRAPNLSYAVFLKIMGDEISTAVILGSEGDCNCETDFLLYAAPGWAADTVEFEGMDGDYHVYKLKSTTTPNYAVGNVLSQDGGAFHIVDTEEITGDWQYCIFGIAGGSYLLEDITPDLVCTSIGYYFVAGGKELRIKVEPI